MEERRPSATRLRYRRELAVAAAVSAAWTAWLVTGYGGPTVQQGVSNVGLTLAALGAGAACVVQGRRSTGRNRRVWLLLGFSALSWGTGQSFWIWYETVNGVQVPFPGLADVGYLGFPPLAAAGLLTLPVTAQSMAGRVRTVLDGLLIAGSLLLISWVLVLGPLIRAADDNLLALVISLAYPIGDIVVVTILLYMLVRIRLATGAAPIPLGLVAFGLVSISVADTGFAYLTLTEAYASGNYIDVGWFTGFTLILVAARKPADLPRDGDEDEVAARPFAILLPYIAVLAAVATSVLELVRTGEVDAFVSWNRSLIIVMMVGRQLLTLLENLSLTRHLESRVVERTAELRASEQRFEALVQHSSDFVTVTDVDGVVLYQSESVQRVLGHAPDALLGHPLGSLLDPSSARRLVEALHEASGRSNGALLLELPMRHHAGHTCQVETTITNLLDNPSVRGLVLNTHDISERKTLEDQLVHEAFHDSLTALANRALFKDRVDQALRRRLRHDARIWVLFLDLDGFKEVNDSLGHASGDLLLTQVAGRLRECVRPEDTVARFGGDEFAVLIEDASYDYDGIVVAERITQALREPFPVGSQEIHVRASIGIATAADGDIDGSDQLLRNADLAMYRAKATGEGGFERYDPEMHTGLVERLQLETDLRRAIESGELEVHYQPTIELATGSIVGFEALARWHHQERGLVAPTMFIPLAEGTGLIRELGRWILQEACRSAAGWQGRAAGATPLTVSVNVSGRQLQHADLADDVAEALRECGLPPSCLVLEMTETVLMNDKENLALLTRLKSTGVRLAIDDFGTGYSSLSYLHRFPVDILKIDKSFVERLHRPSGDAELARTIVQLGQSLGMTTIAEGVENYGQFLALRRMACDHGQGFYFSPPIPSAEVERLLSDSQPAPASVTR